VILPLLRRRVVHSYRVLLSWIECPKKHLLVQPEPDLSRGYTQNLENQVRKRKNPVLLFGSHRIPSFACHVGRICSEVRFLGFHLPSTLGLFRSLGRQLVKDRLPVRRRCCRDWPQTTVNGVDCQKLTPRIETARCELALQSEISACCSEIPASLCWPDPVDPTRKLGEAED